MDPVIDFFSKRASEFFLPELRADCASFPAPVEPIWSLQD
jgi:hypothetical protein